jgi:hypothetical protein
VVSIALGSSYKGKANIQQGQEALESVAILDKVGELEIEGKRPKRNINLPYRYR